MDTLEDRADRVTERLADLLAGRFTDFRFAGILLLLKLLKSEINY
jgi:hypothetical protein